MTEIKAVLFDLDDTLFDHSYAKRRGLETLQKKYPPLATQPVEFLDCQFARDMEAMHLQVLAGTMTPLESFRKRFCRLFHKCGAALSAEEAERVAQEYQGAYRTFRYPVAGAIPLLKELRHHVTIGVVTNSFAAEQRAKLQVCGLANLIHFMLTSEEAGAIKPDAAIFRMALNQAGCRADQAVFVGDSFSNDVLGAHRVGLRPVWLNRHRVPCPQPGLAAEVTSLEPLEFIFNLLLYGKARLSRNA